MSRGLGDVYKRHLSGVIAGGERSGANFQPDGEEFIGVGLLKINQMRLS